jgi:hypothetical protein
LTCDSEQERNEWIDVLRAAARGEFFVEKARKRAQEATARERDRDRERERATGGAGAKRDRDDEAEHPLSDGEISDDEPAPRLARGILHRHQASS